MAPEPIEARLVAAAQGGDRRALEQILTNLYDRFLPLAYRLLGDRTDAEDATQDALLAVVRGLASFDGRAAFSTWSYRVATNACLDELRRRRRRPATTTLEPDRQPAAAVGARDDEVDDRLDVAAALTDLSPEFRSAVVLRDLCDLDYAEIADVLDIPPGTVRSRIARGRAALADSLLGNQDQPSRRRTEVP